MKHCHLLRTLAFRALALTALVLMFAAPPAGVQAQNARIHHKITTQNHVSPQMGRDLWFTLITNYGAGGSGKYYALYVTSPNITNVHIHITGGITKTIQVQPYQSAVFNIPLAWEMLASGKVDDFGVHVWSNDADICAYVMSHNPYTSDGMYVIPVIGWGTEYVVAAYASLFEGFGSYVYDEPTEFGIVANQDNTRVSITPTCDIRIESTDKGCCSCILGTQGQTFQVVLNAGQSVQYKATCTQNCDNFDLTGTVITSNNPIGLECGSECPNIPCDFPYCDHVLDYIPPVRTWAENYYSIPFYQPPAAPPSHTASTFLVITTKPGQVIYRYDNAMQMTQTYFSAGGKKYDSYWRNDIDQGSHWFSDAPFLLVQYINSSSYPDNVNGQGDPAEVVINSSDQFTKDVVFQTPISIGNQSPYTNYVNIIAKPSDKHVTLDGVSVIGLHAVYIDGIYTGYRASNVKPGGHIVKSDSGCGVYIYGYGWDESYAWTGSFATTTYNSKDTTPPTADTTGQCFTAHVDLKDMDGDSGNVGIYYMRLDSINNMSYTLDPTWIDGKARTTTFYDMVVPDLSKPGILIVSGLDAAGNMITVTSTYIPQSAHIGPPLQDFGTGNPTNCIYMYDTIINTGKTPFPFTDLHLVLGDQGFSIDSADRTPLGVGEVRKIKICFVSVKGATVFDTIRFGDPCTTQDVVVTGSGGAPDFRVTGHDWGTLLLTAAVTYPATTTTGIPIEAVNTSATQPIIVNEMWVDDSIHFIPTKDANWASATNPVTIDKKDHHAVTFTFKTTDPPDVVGHYETKWYVKSNQLVGPGETGIRYNILKADVIKPTTTFTADQAVTMDCVDTAKGNDTAIFRFEVAATGNATSIIKQIRHNSTANAKKNATNPNDLFVSNFTVQRDNGSVVLNPDAMSEQLQGGSKLFVTDTFVAPMYTNGVYVDTFWAYELDQTDGSTKLIGIPLTATATVDYRYGAIAPGTITFAPVKYTKIGAVPVCQTFTITDTTGSQPLQVDSVYINTLLFGNSAYAKAFTITTNPPFPASIPPGGVMTVSVCFDPSFSFDSTQAVSLSIMTSSCLPTLFSTVARTTVSGAAMTGFAAGTFSACENPVSTVTIFNLQPIDKTQTPIDNVPAKIISATFLTHAGKEFSWTNGDPTGTWIDGMGSLPVQVTFNPDPTTGVTVYNDIIMVVLQSSRSTDTVYQPIQHTAITEAITATAGSGAKVIADNFTLPLTVAVNTNGLTEPLANRKISQVRYTIMLNSNLLNINPTTIATNWHSNNAPNNWTVDGSSTLTLSGNRAVLDKLVLVLNAPVADGAMTEANISPEIGHLDFQVMLTDSSDATALTLVSTDLLTTGGATAGCISPTSVSGNFTASLLCGNKTLRAVMNGATEIDIVKPATPDPVTGGTVTFSYANRGEGTLTLAVYDVLGNQVALPMDRVHQGAGSWQVACDVSNLPSGQYTYRLTEGRNVISKQFVIQR